MNTFGAFDTLDAIPQVHINENYVPTEEQKRMNELLSLIDKESMIKRKIEKTRKYNKDNLRSLPIMLPLSEVKCGYYLNYNGKGYSCDNICLTPLQMSSRLCYKHINIE